MKKLFMIVSLVLILCLILSSQVKETETSSQELEKELRATLKRLVKAWNEHDLDTITKIIGDSMGYGYRTPAPRLIYNRKRNKWFYDSMEIFETIPKDNPIIRVVGNVGIVIGILIEKFKPKGGELQTIEVRFSMTFIRVDGKWKRVLYHRDTQFAK